MGIRKLSLLSFLFFSLALLIPLTSHAQGVCGPTSLCQTDADCFNENLGPPCPQCFFCNTNNGACEPLDANCDDNNDCTEDLCISPNPNTQFEGGCENLSLALGGDPDLPIECYICEPTENGVTVNNGVCDSGVGENCSNAPLDCLVPDETCATPPPPGDCDFPFPAALCADGDRCTEDLCVSDPGGDFCDNPPLDCLPNMDGCCPANCVGPISPATCFDPAGAAIPGCDADCWPPQSCGDGFVQAPETCDDAADMGDAGLAPDGTIVTNADCRDPGTAAECTYCGDGIIQTAAGEECDGTDVGICGTAGCDTATCLCLVTDLLVQGSGPPFGGPCSLTKDLPTLNATQGLLGWGGLGFAMVLLLGLRKRGRKLS